MLLVKEDDFASARHVNSIHTTPGCAQRLTNSWMNLDYLKMLQVIRTRVGVSDALRPGDPLHRQGAPGLDCCQGNVSPGRESRKQQPCVGKGLKDDGACREDAQDHLGRQGAPGLDCCQGNGSPGRESRKQEPCVGKGPKDDGACREDAQDPLGRQGAPGLDYCQGNGSPGRESRKQQPCVGKGLKDDGACR